MHQETLTFESFSRTDRERLKGTSPFEFIVKIPTAIIMGLMGFSIRQQILKDAAFYGGIQEANSTVDVEIQRSRTNHRRPC